MSNADTALVLLLEVNVRGLFVNADSETFEFLLDDSFVCQRFIHIEHDEDEMASFGDCDNLSSTALAIFGALNDTRQIQDLNFGAIIQDLTRHGRKLEMLLAPLC